MDTMNRERDTIRTKFAGLAPVLVCALLLTGCGGTGSRSAGGSGSSASAGSGSAAAAEASASAEAPRLTVPTPPAMLTGDMRTWAGWPDTTGTVSTGATRAGLSTRRRWSPISPPGRNCSRRCPKRRPQNSRERCSARATPIPLCSFACWTRPNISGGIPIRPSAARSFSSPRWRLSWMLQASTRFTSCARAPSWPRR